MKFLPINLIFVLLQAQEVASEQQLQAQQNSAALLSSSPPPSSQNTFEREENVRTLQSQLQAEKELCQRLSAEKVYHA